MPSSSEIREFSASAVWEKAIATKVQSEIPVQRAKKWIFIGDKINKVYDRARAKVWGVTKRYVDPLLSMGVVLLS